MYSACKILVGSLKEASKDGFASYAEAFEWASKGSIAFTVDVEQ